MLRIFSLFSSAENDATCEYLDFWSNQPESQVMNYFHCNVPAKKRNYRHGPILLQLALNSKEGANNAKLKFETLVLSVGANLKAIIRIINCLQI